MDPATIDKSIASEVLARVAKDHPDVLRVLNLLHAVDKATRKPPANPPEPGRWTKTGGGPGAIDE